MFAAIGPQGTLGSAAFCIGPATADASDRIVYDRGTGRLHHDADGNGLRTPILFAVLDAGLAPTPGDFVVG